MYSMAISVELGRNGCKLRCVNKRQPMAVDSNAGWIGIMRVTMPSLNEYDNALQSASVWSLSR